MSQKQSKENKARLQIIIKQASNHLGVRPGSLVVGDLRDQMAREMLKGVEEAVLQNDKKAPYYILVTARKHAIADRTVKTTIIVMREKPPRMLGTMLFYVDNQRSKIERLWVLPLDIPRPDSIISDIAVPEIGEAGKSMPLLH